MQYMLLIYNDPQAWDSMSEDERGAIYNAYGTFSAQLQGSGKMVAGDGPARARSSGACWVTQAPPGAGCRAPSSGPLRAGRGGGCRAIRAPGASPLPGTRRSTASAASSR